MGTLAAQSKIWIYQAEHTFSTEAIEYLEKELDSFCLGWTAHNTALKAGFRILYRRFILLMVDETNAGASGCSIDKSVNALKEIGNTIHNDLFDRLQMAYFEDEKVRTLPYNTIKSALLNGDINEDTLFFDTNIRSLAELETDFLKPLKKHWLWNKIQN